MVVSKLLIKRHIIARGAGEKRRKKEERTYVPYFQQPTNRRVSCKDLGRGDCQGWLYKKREGHRVIGKWAKRWCVLLETTLYYYKHPEDDRAQGTLFMPVFRVSIAPEIKSKKYAFKAYHSGTTFYFASERFQDQTKWMNKMSLAAISYDASQDDTTAGFIRPGSPTPSLSEEYYFSESDGETDSVNSSIPSSPASIRTQKQSTLQNTPTISAPEPQHEIVAPRFTPSPTPERDTTITSTESNTSTASRSRKAHFALDFQLSSPHSVKSSTLSPTGTTPPRPTRYIQTTKKSPAKNPRTKLPAKSPPMLQRRGSAPSIPMERPSPATLNAMQTAALRSGSTNALNTSMNYEEPLYGNLMYTSDDYLDQPVGGLDDAIPASGKDDDYELHQLYRDIKSADLFIDGNNKKTRRTSTLSPSQSMDHPESDNIEVLRKISCMERTLKAKQIELKAIEDFLAKEDMTKEAVSEFRAEYSNIVEHIEETSSTNSSSDLSSEDEDKSVFT